MQITPKTPVAKSGASKPPQAKEMPKHEPGLIRDIVEKGSGVLGAAFRIPGSLLSGSLIGGYQGYKKGKDANHEIRPEAVAKGMIVANTTRALAVSAATGYFFFGPAGAAINSGRDAAGIATDTYLFIKGGSAAEMGRRLANDIEEKVEAGQGAGKGLRSGAMAGSWSAAKGAAFTGWQEGKGGTSGIIEGLAEVPKEIKAAKKPKGTALVKTMSAVAGMVGAVMAAPAGLATGIFNLVAKSGSEPSTPARWMLATGSGAAIGAAAGVLGGPVGMAIGAGIGAAVGLLGPTSRKKFNQGISESLKRAEANDGDMGHAIANKRRDLTQRIIVTSLAGARQGWDSAVGLFVEDAKPDTDN